MFKKKLKNILWIFPFISFVFGYYFLHTLLQKKEIFTPNVIGQNIQSAMKGMSKCGLNIRLLREQEDSDLPAGIVLEQIPKPNQMVRPNQHVFVTISKRPQTVLAPDFLGQRYKFIVKQVAKLGIHAKVFWLQSTYPKNFCIAQSPQPEQEMRDQKLIIYVSSGSACDSKKKEDDLILKSLGLNGKEILGSLRLTLDEENSEKDIKKVVKEISKLLN